MITDLIILVEGVIMGRVFEQATRGAIQSGSYWKDSVPQVLDRVRAMTQMLPDLIAAARDQALQQRLREDPIREAREAILKHVKARQKVLG